MMWTWLPGLKPALSNQLPIRRIFGLSGFFQSVPCSSTFSLRVDVVDFIKEEGRTPWKMSGLQGLIIILTLDRELIFMDELTDLDLG